MHPEDITIPYGNVRFWAKVEVEGPDGCWLWTASTDDWGYGTFGWFGGKVKKAHRIVYEAVYSPIPDGMKVCHTCDTPACVNPAHLWLGTDKDNSDDKIAKGRAVYVGHSYGPDHWTYQNPGASPVIGKCGEENPTAKFTEADIIAIRRRYAEGDISQAILAKEWGTEQTVIRAIVRRFTWKHVDDPDAPPAKPRIIVPTRGEATGHAKVTADDVRAIRTRYAAGGISMKALGGEYGMSAASVCLMVQHKTWTHVE